MSIFSIDMGGLINERHCCDNSQQGISEKKRWAPTNGRRFNPCLVGTEDFVRISMDANLLDCLGRRRYFPSRGHFLAIAEGNLIIWNAFAVSSPTTTTIWLLFVTFQMTASTGQARGHRNLSAHPPSGSQAGQCLHTILYALCVMSVELFPVSPLAEVAQAYTSLRSR